MERIGNILVIGELQISISDDDLKLLAETSWVTPHDLDDVPEHPVYRIDTGDSMGCFVVTDRDSECAEKLNEQYLLDPDGIPS